MAALTTQNIGASGAAITFTSAAGGGDTFQNSGQERLIVKNGSGASITVTITSTASLAAPVTVPNFTATVAAGAEFMFPRLDPAFYNNSSNNVAVGYSAVTTVTVAVVRP